MSHHDSLVRAARSLAVSLAVLALLAPSASMAAGAKHSKSTSPGAGVRSVAPPRSAVHRCEFRDFVVGAPTSTGPSDAGLVIGIDPETGALGSPTLEQMARLAANRTATARPAPVHHADGSMSMLVRSWMRDYAIARVDADRRLVTGCLEDRASAVKALHAPLPARTITEEE